MYQQVGNETRAEGVTDGLEMGRTVADSPVPGLVLDVALASAEARGGWEGGEPLSGVRELSVESGWVWRGSGIEVGLAEGCVGVKLEDVTEGWVELVGAEGVLAPAAWG